MGDIELRASLCVSSIRALKQQLISYNEDLSYKCEKIVSRLIEEGYKVAQSKIGESPLGKYISISTNIIPNNAGCNGILLAKGAIKESEGYEPFSILLAVEFGAGIKYNPTPNPLTSKIGYGVGTFPGQVHAFQDTWWYWDEKSRDWRPTHGVKATMPMYNADIVIIQRITSIAKEVFG